MSLKGFKSPTQFYKAKVRPTKLNKRMRSRRPKAKKLERKKRELNIKDNKTDDANYKMVVPLLLKLIISQSQVMRIRRRENRPKMLLK